MSPLIDGICSLSISDSCSEDECPEATPEFLQFTPNPCCPRQVGICDSFDLIPRYLFRVISSRSFGENTAIWQRSLDAVGCDMNSDYDLL